MASEQPTEPRIIVPNPVKPEPVHQYWVEKDSAAGASDAIRRALDADREAGMTAFAFHLGPRGLERRWDALAKLAIDAGMMAVAASGVDGSRDPDGTKLTASEKGGALGRVAARASCAAMLVDAEGQYDSDQGPNDDTDEAGAIALGEALRAELARAGVPDKPVGDQPWFAIDSHGGPSARTPQNPWRGFPADEFAAKAVNWCRYRQLYINNSRGKNRYRELKAWMDRDWAEFDATMRAAGRTDLILPLGVTCQGYGWQDIVADLCACLIEYCGQKQQPVFLWGEPNLASETASVIRAFYALRNEGFVAPGRGPTETVRLYQTSYNDRASTIKKLDVDGRAGPKTLASLGVTLG